MHILRVMPKVLHGHLTKLSCAGVGESEEAKRKRVAAVCLAMRCYREKCRADIWGSFTERFDSVCSSCERRYSKGGARRSMDAAVIPTAGSTL
jgi:hypothetical protein